MCVFGKTLRLIHRFVQDLKLTEQVACAAEGQATRRVAQRAIRLGVEFKKHTIRARRHGCFRQHRHTFAPPACGRAPPLSMGGARVGTGKLNRMGGIHRHRHTELFHLGNTQHIDNQIIIAKTRTALAQDNIFITRFSKFSNKSRNIF